MSDISQNHENLSQKVAELAKSLNRKQLAFADAYLANPTLNQTKAAISAGYAEKHAAVTASKLLKQAKVADYIEAVMAERRARVTHVDQDKVLKELACMGFANMQDFIQVQDDGTAYVDLSCMTREMAAAVTEITVEEYKEGKGENARDVRKVKLKLADKRGPLELLGRHLGMKFREEKVLTGPNGGPIQVDSTHRLSDAALIFIAGGGDPSKLVNGEPPAQLTGPNEKD